ncbi:sodium:solute symporter [Vulgatibacter sp.]|uniref:sodium:solute symporter n=1 Tax=Vulgatibacter sp. TaxID=1971226 RepID=UPI003569A8DF
MTSLDWSVLVATIGFIVIYGAWKSRGVATMESYVRGDSSLKWPTIGLSIMATQASAITFLSTPGQAYEDGMRFVQFYFGLPLAMVVIAAVFVPIYYRLKVYTAYEYLEHRFDHRVRYLGAVLFLIQRGLAAGITIYAPSIILSSILGWPLDWLIVAIGLLVIAYTVSGGTRAVSQTQKQQMIVMMGGMIVAAVVIVWRLPENVSMPAAVGLAGALDRMNVVSFDLDLDNRYNFWSGMTGGFFLALSYFGTDQSQVQRYLSGRSVTESRLGLLFNGMFKVPMQFLILFIGVLVFVFHLFQQPPLFFNQAALERVEASSHAPALHELQARYETAFATQRAAAEAWVAAREDAAVEAVAREKLRTAAAATKEIRGEAKTLVATALPGTETKDADYVFVSFVLRYLPAGLVGLLIAVILCAAMSSTASELNALGSTSTIDLYKRAFGKKGAPANDRRDLLVSKGFTVLWGLVAIGFASFASLVDNLIEAVNILGSIFYGTVLGLFVVAFFLKRVTATPVLLAALVAQAVVAALFFASELGFLWFNVVGCAIVVVLSLLFEAARSFGGGGGLAIRGE